MLESYTPPEIAKRYRVNTDKVHGWVHSGELPAIDVSTKPGGRPRWRITAEALQEFEERRSSQPPKKKPTRRRRSSSAEIIEYV